MKSARPEKLDAARQELKAAEESFNAQVDDAIVTMRAVIENVPMISNIQPESMKCLRDLIEAQRQFYSRALEAFEAISL